MPKLTEGKNKLVDSRLYRSQIISMKRRQFLQYSTLAAAGLTFAACTNQGSTHFTQPPVNFGKLEKTDLKIGIVSGLDCLPLVVAKEKGCHTCQTTNLGASTTGVA
jgi:hypothetical protein